MFDATKNLIVEALKLRASANDLNLLSEDDKTGSGYIDLLIDEKVLKKDCLFRKYGTVNYVEKYDGRIIATVSNSKASLVGEGESIPEDDDSITQEGFSSYKIGSLVKLKTDFVLDEKYDVYSYLQGEFSRRFGKAEEDLFINGSGEDEPLGILNAVDSGAASTSLTYDAVVDLFFGVPKDYRKNAIWIMNDETALALRKLKDENGQPLWNANNDTILGKEVAISPFMTNEEKPIIFGDISYFWIIVRKALSVKIAKELYAPSGNVGYIGIERLDGKLIINDAVKFLQINSEAKRDN